MVWKTNFDKLPSQDSLDTQNQRLSTQSSSKIITSSFNRNNASDSSNNVIHVHASNGLGSSYSSSSSSQRDQSPLTIPLNESNLNEIESINLNSHTTELAPASVTPKRFLSENKLKTSKNLANLNHILISNGSDINSNWNDKISNYGTSGSILKKLTNDQESIKSSNQLNNLSNTLEHIVQQLDILTQVQNIKFKNFTKKLFIKFFPLRLLVS